MAGEETGIKQPSAVDSKNHEPSKLSALGAAAVLALSVNTADAADKLAGDVFIHVAGYKATAGTMVLETQPDSNVMTVSYEETVGDGKSTRTLKGQTSREFFTDLLERDGNGLWRLAEDSWFEILKSANLQPQPNPIGGFDTYDDLDYEPAKPSLVDFSDFTFESCDGLKKMAKVKCRVRSGKPDAGKYERYEARVAEAIATNDAKRERNAESTREEGRLDQQAEADKETIAHLRELKAWAEKEVGGQ